MNDVDVTGGLPLNALTAAAQVLLRRDYDRNLASSSDWDGLAPETQQVYLLLARQNVAAFLGEIGLTADDLAGWLSSMGIDRPGL